MSWQHPFFSLSQVCTERLKTKHRHPEYCWVFSWPRRKCSPEGLGALSVCLGTVSVGQGEASPAPKSFAPQAGMPALSCEGHHLNVKLCKGEKASWKAIETVSLHWNAEVGQPWLHLKLPRAELPRDLYCSKLHELNTKSCCKAIACISWITESPGWKRPPRWSSPSQPQPQITSQTKPFLKHPVFS